MIRLLLLCLALLASAPAIAATSPDEMLQDATLEARARDLGKELRCLVCQNQSIDDSDADLAKDLRRLVRERLAVGDSDAEIRTYLVNRYGDFVLLEPPFRPGTWLLWLGPAAAGLVGAIGSVVYVRSRARSGTGAPPLTPAERARLDEVLRPDGEHTT